jgi:hypothetical protein
MFATFYKIMFFAVLGLILALPAVAQSGRDDLAAYLLGPIAIIAVAVMVIVGAIKSARDSGMMYSRTESRAGLLGLFRAKRSATRVVRRDENPVEYWSWLGGAIVLMMAAIIFALWLMSKYPG